jgi:type 1 glutamine amidotransferase
MMGHHPSLFTNENYKTLLRNSILWAAGQDGRDNHGANPTNSVTK